ncbi:hypothetical protein Bbelb_237310 [Branchiostoma belcheri]|nr:hypothetical protein Bbelb_237310 [Branchiostoma belcheri]
MPGKSGHQTTDTRGTGETDAQLLGWFKDQATPGQGLADLFLSGRGISAQHTLRTVLENYQTISGLVGPETWHNSRRLSSPVSPAAIGTDRPWPPRPPRHTGGFHQGRVCPNQLRRDAPGAAPISANSAETILLRVSVDQGVCHSQAVMSQRQSQRQCTETRLLDLTHDFDKAVI